MRQWKIALSLAILGAVAAPFAFHTYKARPTSQLWVPLTAEEKSAISARLKETNNCQTLSDQVKQLADRLKQSFPHLKRDPQALVDELAISVEGGAELSCHLEQNHLRDGGHFENDRFDLLKYLAINAAVAGITFVVICTLALLLPALARRCWKWLNA